MHPVTQLARQCFGYEADAIPFQKEVFDHIVAGRSVILQAPTGSGKTFAALAPFVLGAWGKQKGPSARKLIYSLPLRVLAGSLKAQYEEEVFADFTDLRFTNQYGGAAHDPFLDGGEAYWKPENQAVRSGMRHAIFTTIDQTLSGYLGAPLGLPYRLANMLYGSVLSGALVFDEFHLLESEKSFRTALSLLQKSPWPVLVMTATMSTSLRRELCGILDAAEVIVADEDIPFIRSQHETVKHLHLAEAPLSGAAMVDKLGDRTLVICNTVRRAQQVYHDLCGALDERGDTRHRMLLHSRFLPDDRKAKEENIKAWFGESADASAVLVATQVIEAGLDISCDVMHTEISPIDSFLQRIGRSARFAEEREADIYVYPLEAMVQERHFLPYDKTTVRDTFQHLDHCPDLRFEHIQDLIDTILTAYHVKMVDGYKADRRNLEDRIHNVRLNVEKAAIKELVRDVDNVEVIVAYPHVLESKNISPYNYPAVSVPVSTLWGYFQQGGTAHAVEVYSDEAGQQPGGRYFTVAPMDPEKPWPSRRLVITPAHAAYDAELGLRLGEPGKQVFEPAKEAATWTKYDYERESYQEHIERLYAQQELRQASLDALKRISTSSRHPHVQVNDPERIIDLVIWAHDLAKLTDGWQAACGDENPPLAHGGRLPNVSPPPHAAESTFAAQKLIMRLLSQADESRDTCIAALVAIRTHHSPKAKALSAFCINRERQAYLRSITPRLHTGLAGDILKYWSDLVWTNATADKNFSWYDIPQHADPVFALIIYMLRRSDQLATSEVSTSREIPAAQVKASPNIF